MLAFVCSFAALAAYGQESDLSILKTGPATAAADTDVTFTITVTNNGPDDAASVDMQDNVIGGWTTWDYSHYYLKEMRSIWRDSTLAYSDRIDALRTAGWLDSRGLRHVAYWIIASAGSMTGMPSMPAARTVG